MDAGTTGPVTPPAGRPFTFGRRLRSVRYAVRGVRTMVAGQHNAWVHAAATAAVIAAGVGLGVSAGEWCWLGAAMTAVWTAEALNTAFEFLCDVASPGFHPAVEKARTWRRWACC